MSAIAPIFFHSRSTDAEKLSPPTARRGTYPKFLRPPKRSRNSRQPRDLAEQESRFLKQRSSPPRQDRKFPRQRSSLPQPCSALSQQRRGPSKQRRGKLRQRSARTEQGSESLKQRICPKHL